MNRNKKITRQHLLLHAYSLIAQGYSTRDGSRALSAQYGISTERALQAMTMAIRLGRAEMRMRRK